MVPVLPVPELVGVRVVHLAVGGGRGGQRGHLGRGRARGPARGGGGGGGRGPGRGVHREHVHVGRPAHRALQTTDCCDQL